MPVNIDHPPVASKAAQKPVVTTLRGGSWLQLGSVGGFERKRIDFHQPQLAGVNGLRVVHLTDLHLRQHWDPAYDELIALLRDDPPDLLLYTGDFVDDKWDHRPAVPTLERLLTQLSSRHGFYAILGNHDGDLLGPRLRACGVQLIAGRREVVQTSHGPVELIGLPSVARSDLHDGFIDAMPRKREDLLRVVLGHYPDQVLRVRLLHADIVLAGHTHGGQICTPWGWPPVTHDSLPRRCAQGVHCVDKTWLVVNRGFGFATFAVRAFCPAEVIEILVNAEE